MPSKSGIDASRYRQKQQVELFKGIGHFGKKAADLPNAVLRWQKRR
jgi:hypothetical protein